MEKPTTRIIKNHADIAEGVAALIKIEPKFRIASEKSSPIPLRRKPSGFAPLLQAIVGQQISVAAAAGIWKRIEAANATTPDAVLAMSDDELRACGLSRPKVKYARAIAEAVKTKSLSFDYCRDAPAPKDLALQEAARRLFDLETRPTSSEMSVMAEAWSPWRAVAARILWAYYRTEKGREGINA